MSHRLFRRIVIGIGLVSGVAVADTGTHPFSITSELSQTSWLGAIWHLPIFDFFPTFDPTESGLLDLQSLLTPPPPPPCSIEPLPPIEDAEALAFEDSAEGGPRVDLSGLTPATSRALARFERVVSLRGGDIWLTSAYRPPAYQQHLQIVWDKWSVLRDNQDPACSDLKGEVEAEFAGHQLLPTQRPVTLSDHTRGTGFDAAVTFPILRRSRGRAFNIDRLARLAGIRRPDIVHDPVHFRVIAR